MLSFKCPIDDGKGSLLCIWPCGGGLNTDKECEQLLTCKEISKDARLFPLFHVLQAMRLDQQGDLTLCYPILGTICSHTEVTLQTTYLDSDHCQAWGVKANGHIAAIPHSPGQGQIIEAHGVICH